MSIQIDTRVSPTLHPDIVRSIEGYDEMNPASMAVIKPIHNAFSNAYRAITSVYDGREAARSNPSWNEAEQVIRTDDLKQDKIDPILREFDTIINDLQKNINQIESNLNAPVQAKAAQNIAQEIRAYTKNLSSEERNSFLMNAVKRNDETTATAVLGAPPYLSGLSETMAQTMTRHWHETNNPEQAQKLTLMKSALEMVIKNSPLIFNEMEKAVGVMIDSKSGRKITAADLRKAKIASEKAFYKQR